MIKSLIEYVVASVVEKPEQVVVTQTQEKNKYIITISVDQQDIGKVIGRDGRTIKALRTLLNAVKPPDWLIIIDIVQ